MPKTFTAPFAQTVKTSTAVVTTATGSIATDAPTNTALLLTAGTEGTVVNKVSAAPRSTITDASLLLFLSKDGGTTKRLIGSVLMKGYTLAATTAIPETAFAGITSDTPIRLETGDSLYVGSQVALASGIVFTAQGMDY